MPDPLLKVRNISKRFGERYAVRSVSFEVSRGEVFGLLGPNGAGKTTLLSVIAGIIAP
ncbi:MAG TPA: ATP-binding cassette domain-containing protein, partial [Nitrososphaeria archaeon]|nr:ATP-binding cassette domain-containing protein [Nitrososphaeria archaeon]